MIRVLTVDVVSLRQIELNLPGLRQMDKGRHTIYMREVNFSNEKKPLRGADLCPDLNVEHMGCLCRSLGMEAAELEVALSLNKLVRT